MSTRFWAAFSAGAFCAFLSACSQQAEVVQKEDILDFDTEVSEADLRAARLLSLSNNGSLQPISDPYELAVSCVVSIQTLAGQLRTINGVTSDQLRAIDAAVHLYRRRGLDTGKSPAELNQDVEKRRADDLDVSEQARMGVSCLRRLA